MKAVLFDLDGTLLPLSQDDFIRSYFGAITKAVAAPLGYSAKAFTDGLMRGMYDMVKNDGSRTNEQAFWQCFAELFGEKVYADIPRFDEFYRTEFSEVRKICGFNAAAAKTVARIKASGLKIVLASNPFFPLTAQKARMRWAGLEPDNFDYITSYENSHFCKPNPRYYDEIFTAIGCGADECLMVGNDVEEDMIASVRGAQVFLLTDCLINAKQKDVGAFNRGNFADLNKFLNDICEV